MLLRVSFLNLIMVRSTRVSVTWCFLLIPQYQGRAGIDTSIGI